MQKNIDSIYTHDYAVWTVDILGSNKKWREVSCDSYSKQEAEDVAKDLLQLPRTKAVRIRRKELKESWYIEQTLRKP